MGNAGDEVRTHLRHLKIAIHSAKQKVCTQDCQNNDETDAHGNQQLVYKAKISTIAMHSGRPAVSIQRARKPRVSMAPRPHGGPSRYDDNQGGSSEQ